MISHQPRCPSTCSHPDPWVHTGHYYIITPVVSSHYSIIASALSFSEKIKAACHPVSLCHHGELILFGTGTHSSSLSTCPVAARTFCLGPQRCSHEVCSWYQSKGQFNDGCGPSHEHWVLSTCSRGSQQHVDECGGCCAPSTRWSLVVSLRVLQPVSKEPFVDTFSVSHSLSDYS